MLVTKNPPIHVIGNGGIGSRVSTTLAEVGFDLSLWDHDVVNEENIGSQKFGFPDLGKSKVGVLKERLEAGYQVKIKAHKEKYKGQDDLKGIVVCGVDSKKKRADIWPFIKKSRFIPLYLDGRVGGERFKLFIVNPSDEYAIERYETHLDLSLPEMEVPCTERFAPQAGLALDFYIWVAIKEHLAGNKLPFIIAGQNFDVRFVD